ncbi:uncharacterized protein MELLADRAFT_111962 [Melampsora larici-populina 98AG31]|uniref:Uncharacterized protein n=1 Tax=Melampsora larici-populina (strain 98AG31 / pathotype 3-4-7) TaxID=747676 RepID=F4S4X7_MELLP|nr:uncharacterized protein MELLADRAFT_111962 [Melampsora larici-populina 98AG31]EGG00222.1 hypothetical protein MELLADRAFT_111962 [Melampsora larici-populina 98AG31]
MKYAQIGQNIQPVDLTHQLQNINLARQRYPDVASMLPDLFRRQTPPRPITTTASPTTAATRPTNSQSAPPNSQPSPSSPTNPTSSRPSQSAPPPRASASPASTPASANNRNGAQQNPATAARPAQVAAPSPPQSSQTSQPANPPAVTTPSNSSTRASPLAPRPSNKPGSPLKPGSTAKTRKPPAQADSKKNLMIIGIACGVGVLLVIIGVIIFKMKSSKRQQRSSVEGSQQASSQFQTSEGPYSMDYIRPPGEAHPSFTRPPPTSNMTYPPLPPPGKVYPTQPNHNIYARESMEFYNPRPPPPILPRHEYNPHTTEKQWRREPSTYDIDGYYHAPTSIASPTGQHIDARYTINEPEYDVMHPDERPYDPRYTLDRRGKLKYAIEEDSSVAPRSRYDSNYFGREYRQELEGSDIDAQSRYSYYPPEHLEVPHYTQPRGQAPLDPPGSSNYYNNSFRNQTRLPYE